ncbi:MAG: hypothetical protein FWB75_02430, partial [Oscillospiraceae bacterium]|nr:hypothetical protein [Oscillospiraceae bacterium]
MKNWKTKGMYLLTVIVTVSMMLTLVGCGGTQSADEAEVVESSIVGSWNFFGSPYYVFEEDGLGTMSSLDIRWNIRENNILSICATPDLCGDNCVAPTEWYYEI